MAPLNSDVRPHWMNNAMDKVFVALLGERVSCWRPVPARHVRDGIYELLGARPSDEDWQFQPGQFVECEAHEFSGGSKGLVARRPAAA